MAFDTQKNKEFLWNMLLDNRIIAPTTFNINPLQHIFESIIKTVDKEKPDIVHTLLEKNKEFIIRAVELIPSALEKLNQQSSTNFQRQPQPQSQSQHEPHLREDISKKRDEEMNYKLKTKQEEFSKLINAKRPTEIDFSDNSEEQEVIKNFQMDRTLEQRERELQNIIMENSENSQKEAEKWITNSSAKPQDSGENSELWNGRLTIQDNIVNNNVIELDIKDKSNETNERRVSFNAKIEQIEEPSSNDASLFLSKLKRN